MNIQELNCFDTQITVLPILSQSLKMLDNSTRTTWNKLNRIFKKFDNDDNDDNNNLTIRYIFSSKNPPQKRTPQKRTPQLSCCICYGDLIKRYACVPCGHCQFCRDCIKKVRVCPLSRKHIQSKIEIHL